MSQHVDHVDTDKDACSVGTWGCNVKEEHMIDGMSLQLCSCAHRACTYKVGKGVFKSV